MTRKEKIILILDTYIPEFSDEIKVYINSRLVKNNIADTILALPLDVPTEEERIDEADDYGQRHIEDKYGNSIYGITSTAFSQGVKKAIEEIEKRNK